MIVNLVLFVYKGFKLKEKLINIRTLVVYTLVKCKLQNKYTYSQYFPVTYIYTK